MAILGPFKVNYPVVFRSGGDTTRVAFGKHIQEIERIYGILNALDADKLSASDLDGKLSGFKPKMSFDDISGSLDLSRTTGNLDGSRITGKIDASLIYGKLSNATIDSDNVNGLQALIKSLIPESKGNGDGITDFDLDENNGYAVFANGLIVQWGKEKYSDHDANSRLQQVSFPKTFPNACINIFLTVSTRGILAMDSNFYDDAVLATVKTVDERTTNAGFTCGWTLQDPNANSYALRLHYLAIGY